ncbi:MAG: hypothetical protein J6D34_00360 [Atopobiaceae bacterium]|nr:hypothetical protein [Atopobiaceae bacterium]
MGRYAIIGTITAIVLGGATTLGFFGFLFSLIVFSTVVSLGLTFFAGRMAWRGGKRLLGWVRDRKLLPGTPQDPSREAQDVVVEPVASVPVDYTPASESFEYVHFDADAGVSAKEIIKVLNHYTDDAVLGDRAAAAIQTLRSAERRRKSISAELDDAFQHGSISWQRFASPAQAALDSILRNSALLANRIQAFDTESYVRTFRSVQRDGGMGEHMGSQKRVERLALYQEMLDGLDAIQETNEGLLLELDKLAAELSSISASGQSDKGDSILEEIRRLVEEAKYYR